MHAHLPAVAERILAWARNRAAALAQWAAKKRKKQRARNKIARATRGKTKAR